MTKEHHTAWVIGAVILIAVLNAGPAVAYSIDVRAHAYAGNSLGATDDKKESDGATSLSAAASDTYVCTSDCFVGGIRYDAATATAEASASADLATGELKLFLARSPHVNGLATEADALASFDDTIHLSIDPGLLPSHDLYATIDLHVHGLKSENLNSNTRDVAFLHVVSYSPPQANGYVWPGGDEREEFLFSEIANSTEFDRTLSATVKIWNGSQHILASNVDFDARLLGGGFNEGFLDLNHTASLGIDLPTGFSFTSDSGVLLTRQPVSVPEPPLLSLLAIAGLTLTRRLKRRSPNRIPQAIELRNDR